MDKHDDSFVYETKSEQADMLAEQEWREQYTEDCKKIGALIRRLDDITAVMSGGFNKLPEFQELVSFRERAVRPLFEGAYKMDWYKMEAVWMIADDIGDPVEFWPEYGDRLEPTRNATIGWGARGDYGVSHYFEQLRPTPSELEKKFDGIGLDELKALSDDEAEATYNQIHEPLIADFWDNFDNIELLNNFMKWRKNGAPDRDVTYAEWLGYMQHRIEMRKEKDPAYGTIPDDIRDKFSDNEWQSAVWIMEDVDVRGPRIAKTQKFYDKSELDEYFTRDDGASVSNLVDKGFLTRVEWPAVGRWKPETRYYLASPFLDKAIVDSLEGFFD